MAISSDRTGVNTARRTARAEFKRGEQVDFGSRGHAVYVRASEAIAANTTTIKVLGDYTLEATGGTATNDQAFAANEYGWVFLGDGAELVTMPPLAPLPSVAQAESSSVSALMRPGRRYAIGVVVNDGDEGQDVKVDIDDAQSTEVYTNTFEVQNNLDNLASAFIEDGFHFDYTGPHGLMTVSASAPVGSTATIGGIIIREADPDSGIVRSFAEAQHCFPRHIILDGELLEIAVEMYTGRRFLVWGGRQVGLLPLPEVLETNDRYHNSGALIEVAGGIAIVASAHTEQTQVIWARTPQDLLTATPQDLPDASEGTYAALVTSSDKKEVFATIRRSASTGGILYRISGFPGYTVTTDHLHNVPLHYPRPLVRVQRDDGKDLIIIPWQGRTGADWDAINVVVFDPSIGVAGQYYNIDGDELGSSAALGTIGSYRLSTAEVETLTTSGNGARILGPATNSRYCPCDVLPKVVSWNNSSKEVAVVFPFIDHPGGAASYVTGTDVRLCAQSGATQVVTDADANPFGENQPKSYRVFVALRWKDNDPSTGVVEAMFTQRNNRTPAFGFDEDNLPTPVGAYYDFGGELLTRFTITDPFDAADAAALLAAVDPVRAYDISDYLGAHNTTGYGLTCGMIEYISGRHVLVDFGQNVLHSSNMQGRAFTYKI